MLDTADSPDGSLRSRTNRVARACDRCRIRKIKCNGKSQCNRCTSDDAICIFTKKRRCSDRAYSKEYVQLLEEQRTALIKGVRELYRRCATGESLPELHEDESDHVLIHDLLKALNVLPRHKDDVTETDEGLPDAEENMLLTVTTNFSVSLSAAFPEAQIPALCKSPTSSSSEPTASPITPSEKDFEGMMNSLDDGQLQTLELMSASKIEGIPFEMISDPCLMTTAYDFTNIVSDQNFVHPRDMSYVSPYQIMQTYPV